MYEALQQQQAASLVLNLCRDSGKWEEHIDLYVLASSAIQVLHNKHGARAAADALFQLHWLHYGHTSLRCMH